MNIRLTPLFEIIYLTRSFLKRCSVFNGKDGLLAWVGYNFLVLTSTSVLAGGNVFTDRASGVSFYYPGSWEERPQRTGAFRVMVGPPGGIQNCTLAIKVVEALAAIPTEDVIKATTQQDVINGAKQSGTDIRISSFERTVIGNRSALLYVSDYDYRTLSVSIPLRSVNVMTKAKDKIYLLSCTSLPEDIQQRYQFYLGIVASLAIAF